MDFNPRMSTVRATPSAPRSRQHEEDNFMTLVRAPGVFISRASKLPADAMPNIARPRDRRLHQRHWHPFYNGGPLQAAAAAGPARLRVVRRAAHEYDARVGRASDACRCGRRGRAVCRDLHGRHARANGILCRAAEAARRGAPLLFPGTPSTTCATPCDRT